MKVHACIQKHGRQVQRPERDKQNSNAHDRSYLEKVMKNESLEKNKNTRREEEQSAQLQFPFVEPLVTKNSKLNYASSLSLHFSEVISSKINYSVETVLGKLPDFPES